MTVVTLVSTIAATLGVALSVIFNAVQVRHLAKQTAINNALTESSGLNDTLERVHSIYAIMIEHPWMRKYFYDAHPCAHPGPQRDQLLLIADMLADVFDYGLMVTDSMPGMELAAGWKEYCLYIMENSPTLRGFVEENYLWYPRLWRQWLTRPDDVRKAGEATEASALTLESNH